MTESNTELPPLPEPCQYIGCYREAVERIRTDAIKLVRQQRYSKERAQLEAEWVALRQMQESYKQQRGEPVHSDDAAVDAFAAAMKAKLAKKRNEGRGNWEDCSAGYLSRFLRECVEKGDPVDVANLAMMLHQNGQRIEPVNKPASPTPASPARESIRRNQGMPGGDV